jgi:hypothetical protein
MSTDTPLTPAELIAIAEAVDRIGHSNTNIYGVSPMLARPLARHVRATLHADDHLPADEEWFAGLPGATQYHKSIYFAGLTTSATQKDKSIYFSFGKEVGVARMKRDRIQVRLELTATNDRWIRWNPTRGQVRHACRSMGHTLQEKK